MECLTHIGSKGQFKKIQFFPSDKIHLIGICGVAMAGMASILKQKGFNVQGSDQNTYPPMSLQLQRNQIPLLEGYRSEHIQKDTKLVIIGNSISSQNPEAQEVMKSQIPYMSLPEAIRTILIGEKQSLVVSGTHGKTTTTSLMSWLADSCGLNPSFLIGGMPNNFEESFRNTESSWCILEGDEYDTAFFDKRPKFIHYQPFSVILTRIEFDHVDIYDSLEKVKSSFEMLVRSLPQEGYLVANIDDKNILDVITQSSSKKVITYGVSQGDYFLKDRKPYTSEGYQEFIIQCPKGEEVQIRIPLFGLHNAMNSLSSFALCHQLGWDLKKLTQGFSTFKGVRRRHQILGEWKDQAVLIEDFAHHPTAVRATLVALKERYPDCDIISVFEPRSISSRRKVFQKFYLQSFSESDKVYVAPPYRGDEIREEDRFSSELLAQDLNIRGVHAEYHKEVDEIVHSLIKGLKRKSVIVVMSNGAFGGIHQKLKTQLSQKFPNP